MNIGGLLLEIITPDIQVYMCFHSHSSVYFPDKFCMVSAKSSGYTVVKTARKSQLLIWTCGC